MKKTIAIISFSKINSDSRVKRQIESLNEIFDILTISFDRKLNMGIDHYYVNPNKSIQNKIKLIIYILFRNYKKYFNDRFSYKEINKFLSRYNIEYYILNDSNAWPLIDNLESRKCIIDAHEYSINELDNIFYWRYLFKPIKIWSLNYLKNTKVRFSVEKNLCKLWEEKTGLKFCLLRNFASYKIISPNHNNKFPIRIIHHGLAEPSRKIENMIYAIGMCGNRYEANFFLTGKNESYFKKLQKIARKNNVKILKPIAEKDLIDVGSFYDIGIISIYPSNINYKYCLPNKFFQYIQSRIPIISGPTPSITEIIKNYNIGSISYNFEPYALKNAILKLDFDSINQMKKNCNVAAKELCWENEKNFLIKHLKDT